MKREWYNNSDSSVSLSPSARQVYQVAVTRVSEEDKTCAFRSINDYYAGAIEELPRLT